MYITQLTYLLIIIIASRRSVTFLKTAAVPVLPASQVLPFVFGGTYFSVAKQDATKNNVENILST